VGGRALNLLLDTAAWINGVKEPETLPQGVLKLLRDEENSFSLSGISLLEASFLSWKKKVDFGMRFRDWLEPALRNVTLLPLTAQIAAIENELPAFFQGDPADRIITATAKAHGLTLLTPDPEIEFHKVVKTVHYKWRPK
jgi:PIN domain nuclease of toxin-antitoxin system